MGDDVFFIATFLIFKQLKTISKMKKLLCMLLIGISCAACGNATEKTEATEKTAATKSAPAGITVNKESVGPIKLGMKLSQLPSKVEGLYDTIVEENSDMVLYSFYLNGETVITTNGDDSIEIIEVFPALTQVTTPDGVHPGLSEKAFKAKAGWKPNGEGGYVKDGVTVYVQDGAVTSIQIGSFEAEF